MDVFFSKWDGMVLILIGLMDIIGVVDYVGWVEIVPLFQTG